jgi:uncharacterized protein (TIRG00374 family)
MEKTRNKLNQILRYAVIFIIFIGFLIVLSHYKHLKVLFTEINLPSLLWALAIAICVYVLEGIFLFNALRLYGEKLPILVSIKSSLVINAIGYFISIGGLTSFATQIHVLEYHGVNVKMAISTRFLHIILFNITFTVLLMVGFILTLIDAQRHYFNLTAIIIAVCFFVFLFTGLYLEIFWKSFRYQSVKIVFQLLNRFIRYFTKKVTFQPSGILSYIEDFIIGFKSLKKSPGMLSSIIGVTVLTWIFWLYVMYLSFSAVNYKINLGSLVVGFTIGQMMGIISMIPGGLGVLEGSMALTYTALHVPLETVLSAILIYRVSFNIVPFFLSMPFYFGLKHRDGIIFKI